MQLRCEAEHVNSLRESIFDLISLIEKKTTMRFRPTLATRLLSCSFSSSHSAVQWTLLPAVHSVHLSFQTPSNSLRLKAIAALGSLRPHYHCCYRCCCCCSPVITLEESACQCLRPWPCPLRIQGVQPNGILLQSLQCRSVLMPQQHPSRVSILSDFYETSIRHSSALQPLPAEITSLLTAAATPVAIPCLLDSALPSPLQRHRHCCCC